MSQPEMEFVIKMHEYRLLVGACATGVCQREQMA